MSDATYDIGDRVTLTAEFSEAGAPVDPTTVTCHVTDPDGTTIELDVEAGLYPGSYSAEVEPDMRGTWWYRFAGVGGYQAAEEGTFFIRKQQVPTE
jgi:hypothetical protein